MTIRALEFQTHIAIGIDVYGSFPTNGAFEPLHYITIHDEASPYLSAMRKNSDNPSTLASSSIFLHISGLLSKNSCTR